MRREAKCLVDARMQFADPTGEHVAHHDAGSTARMPLCRHIFGRRLIKHDLRTDAIRKTMHGFNGVRPIDRTLAAQPAIVFSQTGQDAGHVVGLIRQTGVQRCQLLIGRAHATGQRRDCGRVRIPQIDMAEFIQGHVFDASANIALHGGGQGRQNVTTQVRAIAVERVGDLDADLLGGFRVEAESAVIVVTDERVAQRLDHAVFGQLVRHATAASLIRGQAHKALDRCRRHSDRNLVVADQSGDFLDQITRFTQIWTPARRGDGEFAVAAAGHNAADVGENVGDAVDVHIETGHTGHFGSLEVNDLRTRRVIHIVRMLAGLAVTVLGHELGGHLSRSRLQLGVDATLETTGCFRRNLVATSGTGDGHLIEVRGLQQDVLSVGGHLAVQSTHHTGKAEDTRAAFAIRRISDEQIFSAQVMFLAVQRGELLTLVGTTHNDWALELIEVVGVHRLTEIEHHVVGHVHGQRDGAHASTNQAATHPAGRVGVGVEALDDASVVTIATGNAMNRVVVINLNVDVHRSAGLVISRLRSLLVQRDGRIGVGGTGGVMVLAGNATVRQRVATVRGDVDLEQRLVEM